MTRKAFVTVTFVVDVPDDIVLDEIVTDIEGGVVQFGTYDEDFAFTKFSDTNEVNAHCTDAVELAEEEGE